MWYFGSPATVLFFLTVFDAAPKNNCLHEFYLRAKTFDYFAPEFMPSVIGGQGDC